MLPDHAVPPVLDRTALALLVANDPVAEQRLLRSFRRAHSHDREALRVALDAREPQNIARAAHRIIGACRLAGAHALCRACERLLQAVDAADWSEVTALRAVISSEQARLDDCLDVLIATAS